MSHKIELTEQQISLIYYCLSQTKAEMQEAVSTYTQDNELETAKAFHKDVLEAETLMTFFKKFIKDSVD
jgi:hypothetical protein